MTENETEAQAARGSGDGPHVVVLGGGFAGLEVARGLAGTRARVTLVDRQNHHLFQPLLYQVATAGLAPSEISQPLRSILRGAGNVRVVMDEARRIVPGERCTLLRDSGPMHYDRLVIACGAATFYFGHPEWAVAAPGLKTLDDAVRIRESILRAFEQAELESDPERRRELMRIVVIGGGPTGAELAGALAELTRRVLARDFRAIDPSRAEIVLLEVAPRILTPFSPELSRAAKRQLESLGVDVRLEQEILDVRPGRVELKAGTLRAGNVLWGAGVRAHALSESFETPRDKRGRIEVRSDLSLAAHPEILAIGDIAHVVDGKGRDVPGVAPAAIQMGRYVARRLREDIEHGDHAAAPFVYSDRGDMATLGRSRGVARVGRLEITGIGAWLLWLFVHLVFLIGLRNKLFVLAQWAYSYLAYRRGARLIERATPEPTRHEPLPEPGPDTSA